MINRYRGFFEMEDLIDTIENNAIEIKENKELEELYIKEQLEDLEGMDSFQRDQKKCDEEGLL